MQRDSVNGLPLSEWQLALVQTAQMNGGTACNTVSQIVCYVPLDSSRLTRAIADTVDHHPSLRSSFDFQPGTAPRQLVHADTALQPSIIDLRGLPAETVSRGLDDMRATANRAFDLEQAPLMRMAAYQLQDLEFRLIVVSHPAVLDRWSQRAFLQEVLVRYRAPVSDLAPEVIEPTSLPGSLKATAKRETGPTAFSAWAESFAGFTAAQPGFWITPADAEGPWPTEPTPSAAALRFQEINLSKEHTARLAAYAERLQVSIKDVLLAVHAKAVAVATGRTDIVVGVEHDCWELTAPRPLGMFTTTLAARISVTPGTWISLMKETKRATGFAASFARLSHLRVQRILNVGRLLDSNFAYSEQALEADLLNGERGDLGSLTGHPPITDAQSYGRVPFDGVVLAEVFHGTATRRIRLRLTTGAALSSRQLAQVARLHAEALEHCLSAGQAHQRFSPLTHQQRRLALLEWNGPTRPYQLDYPVHELVEQQVRRTPDAVAVVDSSGSLSYRELNTRANRIAYLLRSRGAGVGSVVGVYTRRDASTLVAFLAVLKAGAAYLPLDPKQPADRVAFMLDDARAMLVLSDRTYAPTAPRGPWIVLRTDETSEDTALPGNNLGRTSAPPDLMYVIYTSGSTGAPKGVEVPHRGVANYLWFGVEAFAGDGHGGAPVFSSVAFDMVVPNLYVPLLMGQRVCMIDDRLDLFAVAERLKELAPFAFIKLTPGQLDTFSELLGPLEAQKLAGRLVVGADAFSVRTLQHWRRLDSATPVLNEYGPTEASVGNTVHYVDGTERGDLLPIGRPIPNTTMYVLDASGSPVPVGVAGDLYIGGACVVRGYANQPDLTRERFVEDLFSEQSGARLYRTGDVGRWLPSGVLEFLGRTDDQVKIRGYRVAPAEVEAVMVRHPSISEAVVSRVGTTREALALAGYYVAPEGLSPEEVRVFLSSILPDYLVPSFLIPISAIPLNRNGKVDRSALPAPGRRQAARARQEAAAAGDIGKTAGRVWADVFAVVSVGIDDPVNAPDGDLAREIQLTMHLARTAGISEVEAFEVVTRSRTFGEFCERLSRVMPQPGGTSSPAPESEGMPLANLAERGGQSG